MKPTDLRVLGVSPTPSGGFCENPGSFDFFPGASSPDFSRAIRVAFLATNHGSLSTATYADGHSTSNKRTTPAGCASGSGPITSCAGAA